MGSVDEVRTTQMHNKSKPDTTFTAVGFAVALVFGIVPLQQARSANAPSPFPPTQLEMRVPFEPTTYSSAGRNHLTYELYLTNFSSSPVTLRRIDVLDADDLAAAPIATYEAGQLDTLVQAIGHQTPAGGNGDPHQLADGVTVVVFLWIALDHGTRVPNQLRHRILTGDSVVEGAVIGTHHTELKLLGPPVTGTNWLADDGPSNDQDNHHRRGILVFEGRAQISRRYAIDWQQSQNGKTFSGDASDKRSYYAYGKPLLAVADGTVVTVRDGLPDNVPRHNGEFTTAVEMTADTIGDQGALGTGLFKSYEVVFNYPNRTLTPCTASGWDAYLPKLPGIPSPLFPGVARRGRHHHRYRLRPADRVVGHRHHHIGFEQEVCSTGTAQPDKGRTHHPTADDWNKEFRAYEVRNLGDGPATRVRRIHGLQLFRPPRRVHRLSRQAGADPLIYCAAPVSWRELNLCALSQH
jgi:hypothetical protein